MSFVVFCTVASAHLSILHLISSGPQPCASSMITFLVGTDHMASVVLHEKEFWFSDVKCVLEDECVSTAISCGLGAFQAIF